MSQPKAKKVGRPKLAEGHAKAHIVPVRFTPELLRRVEKGREGERQGRFRVDQKRARCGHTKAARRLSYFKMNLGKLGHYPAD